MTNETQTQKQYYSDMYRKETSAKVIGIEGNNVVLDQTCFYPEGGGQAGDSGEINGQKVINTLKEGSQIVSIEGQNIPAGGKIVHVLETTPRFSVGDHVQARIDWNRRHKIMKLHSASHIMEHFLFKTFGKMNRTGSSVDEKKDRSDYASPARLDPGKLSETERLCNEFIAANSEILTFSSPQNPDIRVWKCAEIEMLCGGTHPKRTGEIGAIRLKRETKGSGKERIETYLRQGN
ncbi:MAG: alanyl-tRNA editing protein [Candidatus Diapherotrites archaeon]|nr:alanyl-tRNA editing protein [Candidatus Diapherotrites archaeon]